MVKNRWKTGVFFELFRLTIFYSEFILEKMELFLMVILSSLFLAAPVNLRCRHYLLMRI